MVTLNAIQSYTVLFLAICAAVRRKPPQAKVQDHQQPRSQGLSSYHPSGCESGSNPDHASFSSSWALKSTSQISAFFNLKPSNNVFAFQNIDEKIFMTTVNSGIFGQFCAHEKKTMILVTTLSILSVFSWFVH